MTQADLIFRKPITLIGMMGSGKSHLGQALAKATNLPFVDADDAAEATAKCTIPDIFDRYGERAFRDLEETNLAKLLDTTPRIIATGGGVVIRPNNRQALHARSTCIWLKADVNNLVARIASCPRRPLLHTSLDQHARLSTLLAEREAFYAEAAHATLTTDTKDFDQTLADLIQQVTHHG